jgi:hypothetical protein
MTIDIRYTPSSTHLYGLYDPDGDGITFYKSAAERDEAAEETIRSYLSDGEVGEESWYPDFADWLEMEMPEGTVIGDPLWWASKIADRIVRICASQPQPLPSGYIDPEHKGEDLALLETFYRACNAEGGTADEIQLRGIRAVLATHSTPQPPADGEVAELVEWVGKDRQWLDLRRDVKDRILRIADLLQRQRPQPVAVSERLPGANERF